MKTTLGHIATIHTGLFAKPVPKGEIVYLKAKHFDENGILRYSLHPDLKIDSLTEKHLLTHGDVLFAAKGTKNFAAWYESKNQPAVASTSFFVIRLTDSFQNQILPEFLVWFINHPISQKFLKGNAIGTAIVSISKPVLEELELSIPDVKTQKAILKISELHKKEKKIMHRIEELNEKIIQQKILNAIK